MANFSLRRYDTQARFGLVLALLSAGSLVVLTFMVFRHFNTNDFTIIYGPFRKLVVLISGLVTILLAAGGFGFGLNSAGQRRNDKPVLSWIGFFVGAAVFCLAVILLFFFMKQGQQITR